jgi:hypothetical protein
MDGAELCMAFTPRLMDTRGLIGSVMQLNGTALFMNVQISRMAPQSLTIPAPANWWCGGYINKTSIFKETKTVD